MSTVARAIKWAIFAIPCTAVAVLLFLFLLLPLVAVDTLPDVRALGARHYLGMLIVIVGLQPFNWLAIIVWLAIQRAVPSLDRTSTRVIASWMVASLLLWAAIVLTWHRGVSPDFQFPTSLIAPVFFSFAALLPRLLFRSLRPGAFSRSSETPLSRPPDQALS